MAVSSEQTMFLLALAVALIFGGLAGRRNGLPVASKAADVFLAAVVSARVVFVGRYFGEYRSNLWGVLDIRDGGFDLWGGLLGAVFFSGYLLWRHRQLRRPLSTALLAGLMTWSAGLGWIELMDRQARVPVVPLVNLDGEPVDLAEVVSGRPAVVNLWASWCPPCIREMPVLEKAQERYPSYRFVFANQGEHPDVIRRFLSERSLSLKHVIADRNLSLGRVTGNRALPTTLFYDASGTLVNAHRGELSSATLARALESFSEQ